MEDVIDMNNCDKLTLKLPTVYYAGNVPEWGGIEGDINNQTDLIEKFDDIQGEIADLQSDDTELQNEITALQGDVITIQGDITDIHGDFTTLLGKVDTITSVLATNAVDI
jgi:predicted nuclease with TOPRIM domain